jgi:hypothetical protein
MDRSKLRREIRDSIRNQISCFAIRVLPAAPAQNQDRFSSGRTTCQALDLLEIRNFRRQIKCCKVSRKGGHNTGGFLFLVRTRCSRRSRRPSEALAENPRSAFRIDGSRIPRACSGAICLDLLIFSAARRTDRGSTSRKDSSNSSTLSFSYPFADFTSGSAGETLPREKSL